MKEPQSLARFALRNGTWLFGLNAVWLAIIYCFLPHKKLWSDYKQLDIHSGRIRVVEYRLGCQFESNAQETWVSDALARAKALPIQAEWRNYSDNERFHTHWQFSAAPKQMRILEDGFADQIVTSEAKSAIAIGLVTRWSMAKKPVQEADAYVWSLAEWLSAKPEDTIVDTQLLATFHTQFQDGVH